MQIDINIKERNNILEIEGDYEPIVCGNSVYRFIFDLDENWSACENKTAIIKLDGKEYCVGFAGTTCELPALPNANTMMLSLNASLEDTQLSTPPIKLNVVPSSSSAEIETLLPYQNYHAKVMGLINKIESGDITANEARISLSQVSLTGDDEISGTKNFVGNLQKNGTNVATINQISNPNLLINGDFRVNQRAQASYINDTSATKYTVDRWRVSLGNTGLNGTVITPKQNGGVNICCLNVYTGGATPFIQLIENPQNLIGKTLTFSIYCSAIASGSCRFRLSNNITYATGNLQVGLNQISYTVPEGTTQLFCGIICNATTAFDIDLDYAKLEVGDTATPFSPRPYAEELALCQRYFQVIKSMILRASLISATQVMFLLSLPVSMRIAPTLMLGTGSGIQAITGGALDTIHYTYSILTPHIDNGIKIKALPTEVVPTDCLLNFQATTFLDAEIY